VSTPPFLELPAGVRPRTLSTARGDFAILEAGESGPLAVLVPGWTGSKEDFIAVLAPIAARGYRAVSLDQRGQFETPGSGDDYSLEQFGADLLAVISALQSTGNGGRPDAVHLAGHSFGGLVARAATIAAPGSIASLTLLCSGPAALPAEIHPLLGAMIDAIDSVGLAATWQAKRSYDKSNGAPPVPDEIEEFLQRRFLANDPTSLQEITRHLTTAPDHVDDLARTRVPVQVVFGATDDGWPLDVQREMATRLDAPVHVIDGAGHSPAVERPDATAMALTDFWVRCEQLREYHPAS
jgi:pimeloyl-ACP methyl ester carboxylesterase